MYILEIKNLQEMIIIIKWYNLYIFYVMLKLNFKNQLIYFLII